MAQSAMDALLLVLSFRGGFNAALVVGGTTLLGAAAGYVGAFAVLRRRALVGDVIAHAALPGLCLSFLCATALGFEGRSLAVLLPGAALSGLLASGCVQLVVRYSRIREDAALAVILSVFFGAGVVLLSVIQGLESGSVGGLHHFIYGQTAALSSADLMVTVVIALVILVVLLGCTKELALVSFDPEFAEIEGVSRNIFDYLLLALIVVVTIAALQSVGLLLAVALLVIPPSAARYWSERLRHVLALSALFGALSGYIGAGLSSVYADFPAGAVIVLTSGLFFVLSALFGPARGLLYRRARHRVLRAKLPCAEVP